MASEDELLGMPASTPVDLAIGTAKLAAAVDVIAAQVDLLARETAVVRELLELLVADAELGPRSAETTPSLRSGVDVQ